MKASTYIHDSTGLRWLPECKNADCDEACFYCKYKYMVQALEKLHAYEETGLTPSEIRDLIAQRQGK